MTPSLYNGRNVAVLRVGLSALDLDLQMEFYTKGRLYRDDQCHGKRRDLGCMNLYIPQKHYCGWKSLIIFAKR